MQHPRPQLVLGSDNARDVTATQLASTEMKSAVYVHDHSLRIEKWSYDDSKMQYLVHSDFTRPYAPQYVVDAEKWVVAVLKPFLEGLAKAQLDEAIQSAFKGLYLPEREYPEDADVACLHCVARQLPLGIEKKKKPEDGDKKKAKDKGKEEKEERSAGPAPCDADAPPPPPQ